MARTLVLWDLWEHSPNPSWKVEVGVARFERGCVEMLSGAPPYPLGLEVHSRWFLYTLMASCLSLFVIFFGHGAGWKCQWTNTPRSDPKSVRDRKINTHISLPVSGMTQRCVSHRLSKISQQSWLPQLSLYWLSLFSISLLYSLTLLGIPF